MSQGPKEDHKKVYRPLDKLQDKLQDKFQNKLLDKFQNKLLNKLQDNEFKIRVYKMLR